MIRSIRKLRAVTVCAGAMSALCFSNTAHAEVALNDPEKSDGWAVTTNGRASSYLVWVFGETTAANGLGNLLDPTLGPNGQPLNNARYRLIGPQVGISGRATPSGPVQQISEDKDLNTMRIKGGFAATILGFNLRKQISDNLKLHAKVAIWANIDHANREKNAAADVDWREQFLVLEGGWGQVWGGRTLNLYNRGGMRMNWWLIHNSGVGHPCTPDGTSTATCGHSGIGSMFPNRSATIGYATPSLGGFQLHLAMFDPSIINEGGSGQGWVRTSLPRFEAEATFDKKFDGSTDEIHVWANGLSQSVGRVVELPAVAGPSGEPTIHDGVAADATVNVIGVGGGAWARFAGFGFGATGWWGKGLGTLSAFNNTAIDERGELRSHFGYLAILNYRAGNFEIAGSYGSANVQETAWDKDPLNQDKVSVAKEVRGIGGKIAYHLTPVIVSIDGMNIKNTWWRGEVQNANVISAGMLVDW